MASKLETEPTLRMSDSSELLLRLRWLAIVKPGVSIPLAASGGIHSDSTHRQVDDGRRRRGAGGLGAAHEGAGAPPARVRVEMGLWMEENEYTSLAEITEEALPTLGVLAPCTGVS
jgi:dihydroorotate dehydrogenase (fumarate)